MLDVREIVRRLKLGQSERTIAQELGASRNSIVKYPQYSPPPAPRPYPPSPGLPPSAVRPSAAAGGPPPFPPAGPASPGAAARRAGRGDGTRTG